jgi:hypothetical protein
LKWPIVGLEIPGEGSLTRLRRFLLGQHVHQCLLRVEDRDRQLLGTQMASKPTARHEQGRRTTEMVLVISFLAGSISATLSLLALEIQTEFGPMPAQSGLPAKGIFAAMRRSEIGRCTALRRVIYLALLQSEHDRVVFE